MARFPPRRIEHPLHQKTLRIWLAAGSQGPVGLKILVPRCHFLARPVAEQDFLAPRTMWDRGPWGRRVVIRGHMDGKLACGSPLQKSGLVEHRA